MADTSTADIEVDVPGTGVVSFPGDMSHEDIEATIRRGFKPAAADSNIPQLSEAPKKGVLTKIRESLSPLIGPTENQRLAESIPWGKDAQGNTIYKYRPAGGKIEQEGFVPALSHPMIPIPKAPPNPEDSTLKAAAKAVYNTGAGFAEFFESPVGMATGGIAGGATKLGDVASKVIPRVIAAGYGAQMGAQVPEAARQAGTLSVTGTPQEKMEADLGLAGNVVLPGFLASPSTVSRVTRLMPRTLAEVAKIGSDEQAIKPPRHPLLQGADAVEQAAKDVESAGKIPGQNAATAFANARASIDAIGQQLQAAREAPATAAGRPAEVVQVTQAAAQAVLNEAGEAVNRAGEQVKAAPNSPEAAELVKQAVSKLKHLAAQIAIFHGATEQPKEPNAPQERQQQGDVQAKREGNVPVGTPAQAGVGGGVQPATAEPPQATWPRPAAHDETGVTPAGASDEVTPNSPSKPGGGLSTKSESEVAKSNAVKDQMAAAAAEMKAKARPWDQFVGTPVEEIADHVKETGHNTNWAYEMGLQAKPEDLPALKAARDKAYADSKAQGFIDQGYKGQMLNEMVHVREAVQEAKDANTTNDEQLEAIARKHTLPLDILKKGLATEQPAPAGPQMGAAGLGEVAVQGNPDIHGVNNAVREEMAKAGRAQPPVPGEGISPADSVQHGLDLLDGGTDPEQVMQNFEKTKRLNADDIAVVRARGAQLAYIQARIEEKFGTDSDEYRRAMKASDDWQTRYEPMRTDWHKQGQAQQGEVDIDTGTFTGLRRAFKDDTGKEFTPQQAKKAKSMSLVVKQAVIKAEAAKHSLFDLLGKKFNPAEDAEKAALQAVHTHHQEAAARMAEADRKLQVAEEVRRQAIARTFTDAEQAALKSANQTVRDAAVRKAKAERDAAVKEANRQLQFAKAEAAEAKAKEMAAAKKARDAASKGAEQERRELGDPIGTVWKKVKEYIDKGVDDYDDVRNKVATELGMKVDQVTRLMAQDPRVKRLADDVWRKQGQARAMKEQAKRWVASLSIPKYEKVLRSVPGALFSAKVGFGLHGFVALGTHAPFVGFMPRYLPMYLKNFGRMYNMVFSPAFYEQKVQDLYRDPNFATAKRAGLQNDPITYEEYANIDFASALGQKITGMSPKVGQIYSSAMAAGNRGYAILKFLRQDMFNQHWAKMPAPMKTPEMAAAISADVNHLTGVTEAKAPKGLNLLLFAPRLEGSRIMFGAGDPIRALRAFGDWKNATPDQKYFAINQVKEKATIAAVMFGLLEANKAMLKLTGSKQQVNTDDPMRSDFMKFKIAGMDVSYGNPMITMARLPIRLNALRYKGGSGKMAKLIYPDESMTAQLEQYVRSQMSPAAGDAADFIFKGDYENKPLPKMPLSGPQLPMPKRLAQRGEEPYTWSELGVEAVLPIPAEEAVRDVWKNGFGMSEAQIDGYLKAIAKASFMMGTGARLTDDTQTGTK